MKHLHDNQLVENGFSEHAHPKIALVSWVVLIVGLGSSVGIFFSPDAWYQGLMKPTWNPPGWIFGPAWTILYALMAVSVWWLRRSTDAKDKERSTAMRLFWVQLLLNLAWTPIFFGLHQPGLAFMEICLLWLAALATALAFGKISGAAGYLLAPYLAWLSFALVLNGTIWLLNK